MRYIQWTAVVAAVLIVTVSPANAAPVFLGSLGSLGDSFQVGDKIFSDINYDEIGNWRLDRRH